MKRREFLWRSLAAGAGAASAFTTSLRAAAALPSRSPGIAGSRTDAVAAPAYRRLLVLVELKGGNDGLNTLVPYADAAYYALRPTLAVKRDAVVQLDERVGLHPALAPLRAAFEARQLAVLQGVGYPAPNLSHFRSIEIWDTAAPSDRYLEDGWLTRTFARAPTPADYAADAVVIGATDMGPVAGSGARALALADAGRFRERARLAHAEAAQANGALAHLLRTENEIVQAALRLDPERPLSTPFPDTAFGRAVRSACELAGNPSGIACLHLTLNGFDTHGGQAGTHARLLGELADGLVALQRGLAELGRWDDTLVVTYSEFGRRARENASGGTDHGTASAQLVLGGRVRGGLHGAAPDLRRLDGAGNVQHTLDFRAVYATVLDRWWGVASAPVLGGRFEPVPLLQA